jgi:two-component system, NtrC family, sensor histidine kinase PilS
VPTAQTTWDALWGLNRARFISSAVVLAIGAVMQHLAVFPFRFKPFALAVIGIGLACLLLPLGKTWVRDPRRFAWFQLSLDVVLITGIVASTGGPESIFVPLYVLAAVAACFVLPRVGALIVAGLSSLLQIALVAARSTVVLLGLAEPTEMAPLEILAAALNAAMLLIVSMVIASLVDRYRRSEDHLETQQRSLSDVKAFRDLIFESVGSGLVAVDAAGRVTAFNRAAASITGVPAAEALGRPWSTIFGPGVDLEDVRAATDEVAGLPPRYEFQIERRDGARVPVGITFWSLRSGRGDVEGLIGVCQDLSLIKQMEQRMRQADRLATVGRLSANMAHEIRNPLASISGAIEALARELPPDQHRNRLVEIVLRESGRLNDLVGDFLEYARPAPISQIEVDMAELLDEVLLLIEHRPLPPNLKIIREYGEALMVSIDPQQMRQAIWNLCLNAVQALPDAVGEVRVGARVLPGEPGSLQVWIADTGQGIGPEDLPHIFEPFYSTKPEGSGLGLALVYRVMQDHGGQVEAKTLLGEGTTFTLTLPLAAGAARSEPCPSTTRQS